MIEPAAPKVFTAPSGVRYVKGPFGQNVPVPTAPRPAPAPAPLPRVPGSSPSMPVHLGPVPSIPLPPAPPVVEPPVTVRPPNPFATQFIPEYTRPILVAASSMPPPAAPIVPQAGHGDVTTPPRRATELTTQAADNARAQAAKGMDLVAGNAAALATTPPVGGGAIPVSVPTTMPAGDFLDTLSTMPVGVPQTPGQQLATGSAPQEAGFTSSPMALLILAGLAVAFLSARKKAA